jgi:hypothetical protein
MSENSPGLAMVGGTAGCMSRRGMRLAARLARLIGYPDITR